MKTEKQEMVLGILSGDRYKVDAGGVLYSFRKGKGVYEEVRANVLPSGYCQVCLHGGRYSGVKVSVYLHILVYLSFHGKYEEGMVINHKDHNRGNNALNNLECVSVSDNVYHSIGEGRMRDSGIRVIRGEEIEKIKEGVALGWSNARIARENGLNRVSVGYVIGKIRRGEKLKYEGYFK